MLLCIEMNLRKNVDSILTDSTYRKAHSFGEAFLRKSFSITIHSVRVNRANKKKMEQKIPSRVVLEGKIFVLQTEMYYLLLIAAWEDGIVQGK